MVQYSYVKRAGRVSAKVCAILLLIQSSTIAAEKMLDFCDCVIVTAQKPGKVEQKAIAVLQEEIEKRTGIKPRLIHDWPSDTQAVIAVGLQSQIRQFADRVLSEIENIDIPGSEGFCLLVKVKRDVIFTGSGDACIAIESKPQSVTVIVGRDGRGVLYGVGRLLRKMHLSQGTILVPDGLKLVTAPKYLLRGHQLGYRPKTNAYDAWSPAQYDQYIRELALFGTNAIELIPPVSDDDYMSRHMQDPMKMMIRHSEIIDSYGLDVWIWYPNVGKDYKTAVGIEKELAEREEVFRKLKRVDALLVPGGDPGQKKYHPKARIWVSPQAMQPTREWLESFYKYVNKKPKWLGGVVFAPWIKTPLPEMRRIVDKDIKIRRYPDITHNVACQYPVKDWDLALALTLHRECFNPRPAGRDEKDSQRVG
jgi:hypothetical protein